MFKGDKGTLCEVKKAIKQLCVSLQLYLSLTISDIQWFNWLKITNCSPHIGTWFCSKKAMMMQLSGDERIMTICQAIVIQYRQVTDGQTGRQDKHLATAKSVQCHFCTHLFQFFTLIYIAIA